MSKTVSGAVVPISYSCFTCDIELAATANAYAYNLEGTKHRNTSPSSPQMSRHVMLMAITSTTRYQVLHLFDVVLRWLSISLVFAVSET